MPELIPVLGSQPAGEVSHKPDDRLPLLSARPAVTPATLNFDPGTQFPGNEKITLCNTKSAEVKLE